MRDRDYEVMMNSEIMREFIKVKQADDRERSERKRLDEAKRVSSEETELKSVMADFKRFEGKLSGEQVRKLAYIRDMLIENPELRERTDPSFVRAMFVLSLDTEGDS